MARSNDQEPVDLYEALNSRSVADRLNATTRRTKREDLLELFLIAVEMEAGNGELRYPRALLDQAAIARRAGRRLHVWFDSGTFEFVLRLAKPVAATEPEQQELPTKRSDHA